MGRAPICGLRQYGTTFGVSTKTWRVLLHQICSANYNFIWYKHENHFEKRTSVVQQFFKLGISIIYANLN